MPPDSSIKATLESFKRVREAGGKVVDAWTVAMSRMDDDNIVPTEAWDDWMGAHKDLEDALEALDG